MLHLIIRKSMLRYFFLILLSIHGEAARRIVSPKWNTLRGISPRVIARGGFSGLFPDSSIDAYEVAAAASVPDVVLFCDLQLTKDGEGICISELRLENTTDIREIYTKGKKTYSVNGKSMSGWFSLDFTGKELEQVLLVQNIYSRPNTFDGSMPISKVSKVSAKLKPPTQFWLNVQYFTFFKQHGLDAAEHISVISKHVHINFLSSPEVAFLKVMNAKLPRATKLIFRFLARDAVEPSTNSTYGSLLKDLKLVKSFASGILVPKDYIWPVDSKQYLEPSTNLVVDAHKLGLEVYASGFANDIPASYNYSYDPTSEYLQFVDNGDFSVDGVLTDFPTTASEAIACLAHSKHKTSMKNSPLIITHNGASGIFPGCTDLAYRKAVEDGADIIDCSVQMSKDGVPFCLDSPDLMTSTTAVATFISQGSMVPEIQQNRGIFTFDLTWTEIQSLKPQMNSPFSQYGLERNPAAKNQGKLISLPEFLDISKNKSIQGIFINIEHAPYLASKKGVSVVDAVSSALRNASYDKQTTQHVFIQSSDSSVLSKFDTTGYKRVLMIEETISGVSKDSLDEIKKFADAVNIRRNSIITTSQSFLDTSTDVVKTLRHANISVFVSVLKNEFMALAFDYYSDPLLEVATYVSEFAVSGIVTEFPKTAKKYLRNPCADPNAKLSYTIIPPVPGSLLGLAPAGAVSPAEAPATVLSASDVVDPPLPPVVNMTVVPVPAGKPESSAEPTKTALNVWLCLFMLMLSLMCLSYH